MSQDRLRTGGQIPVFVDAMLSQISTQRRHASSLGEYNAIERTVMTTAPMTVPWHRAKSELGS